jgi:HSP20 family molecular chaperone IbpA
MRLLSGWITRSSRVMTPPKRRIFMKKLFVSTAIVSLVLLSNNAFAASEPVQRDVIPIGGAQQDDAFKNDMSNHFKNMFSTFFGHAFGDNDPLVTQNKGFLPIRQVGSVFTRTDMYETKRDIIITMDMPGIKKDDVDIDIAPGIVTVKYEQKEEKSEKDKNYVLSERKYGSFARQFSLPAYALIEEAEAEYKDGVLNITIPKDEKSSPKPRRLEIK